MLKELSLEHFGEAVASEKAVPGGGSVPALAGALAAALAAMVARLTLKKEEFARAAPRMERLERQARRLQTQLMAAVDRDADSYRQVLSVFRRPKTTEEEKQTRSRAIQAAFKHAAEVPLEVAGLSVQIMDLAARAVRQGNPDMIADAGVAVLMARSAALGGLMNVRINLAGIKDQTVVAEMNAAVEGLKKEVLLKEQTIINELPL